MTEIFLGTSGYLISGAHESIFKCLKPEGLDSNIFLYQLLYGSLTEVRAIDDQITVYNDSRLVEELNGVVKPLTLEAQAWLLFIRRHVIPKTKGRIFFNKRSNEFIEEKMKENGLLDQRKVSKDLAVDKVFRKSRKRNDPERFKSRWFGANGN